MMSFLLWIAAKRNGCSMFHVVDEMPIRKIKKEKKKEKKERWSCLCRTNSKNVCSAVHTIKFLKLFDKLLSKLRKTFDVCFIETKKKKKKKRIN